MPASASRAQRIAAERAGDLPVSALLCTAAALTGAYAAAVVVVPRALQSSAAALRAAGQPADVAAFADVVAALLRPLLAIPVAAALAWLLVALLQTRGRVVRPARRGAGTAVPLILTLALLALLPLGWQRFAPDLYAARLRPLAAFAAAATWLARGALLLFALAGLADYLLLRQAWLRRAAARPAQAEDGADPRVRAALRQRRVLE